MIALRGHARTADAHGSLPAYDAEGNPIRRVRQARFQGTLYSEDLSRSDSSGGRIHRVEDFVEGTNTITGRFGFAELPGPDAASTGREVVDLDTFETIFQAGRPPQEFDAARLRISVPAQLTVRGGAFASRRDEGAPGAPKPR